MAVLLPGHMFDVARAVWLPLRPPPAARPRPSRAARFTQADLMRAIKGALAAGLRVAEALVTRDGDIRLIFALDGAVAQSGEANDWD